jgi:hypothetical protein
MKLFNSITTDALKTINLLFLSKRRLILIGAFASIVATIVLLPLIVTITLPPNLKNISINLTKVEVVNYTRTGNRLKFFLNIFFNIYNPTDKSLTTSRIQYHLFADGKLLGRGLLDYGDIPVNGRPQLSSHGKTILQSTFEAVSSSSNTQIVDNIITHKPKLTEQIKWKAIGEAEIDSGLSSSLVQFNSET